MSKKSFRPARAPEEPSADYPNWQEASSRRSFLVSMGKAAAASMLASVALACGDERAVGETDGGPTGVPDRGPYYSEGLAPQMDVYHPPMADSGAAPSTDVPWPRPPDVGPGPDLLGGVPDQAPAPPDMWPQFVDGLPMQPDVSWPPANDAGGAPMPPAPEDGKK